MDLVTKHLADSSQFKMSKYRIALHAGHNRQRSQSMLDQHVPFVLIGNDKRPSMNDTTFSREGFGGAKELFRRKLCGA
jgi:hypothetical protein